MSEPWIRVYLSEMRSDPKISALDADQRYLLIQMWDLAKNGPGEPDELRDADGSPMTPKRLFQVVGLMTNADLVAQGDPPCKTGSYQGVKATIDRMIDLELCERATDGAIRFPTLLRRQGMDRTNAARQARFRARQRKQSNADRNADVTPARNGDVTAESKKKDREKTPTPPSPVTEDVTNVWDAYAAHHPKTPRTIDRVQRIQRRLRDFDADTLIAAVEGNHLDPHCNGENDRGRQYHDLGLILRSADTIERYAAIKREANGNSHTLDQLTAEDFDRIEAERDRITAERRAARAKADDEEIPF